jgi:mitotic spindle assembly checkpoint protein MAD1
MAAESSTHLEKIEELEQALFELGGEIAAGHHVPPGVRVLSLRENPEQAWVDLRQSVMDRLKGENEALLNRLRELEAAAAVNGISANVVKGEELVPRESWELVNKERNELTELVQQKELRLKRLQTVRFSSLFSLPFFRLHSACFMS